MEDLKINIKIKLAGLWTSMMFLYIYADHLSLFKEGIIDEIIALETPLVSQLSFLTAAILMTIPGVMISLSLLLKAKWNRWVNKKSIIALRKRLGLSQEKLAQRLGVSWHTVNRWENDKRKPSQLAIRELNRLEEK